MKLKEKFNNLVPKEFGGMQEPLLSDCEEVADEYAIEFAEWSENYPAHLKYDDKGKYLGLQKLIIVFKKEKGL